ncbi:hypothetical protein [Gillisia limnaea]|uniref:Probable protease Gilli_2517 n=1 Tax=Gillisia limnaea (strain DSM 15749 / LMG 21470 / R-8282) TaxID=865937 RepID=PROT_GILLR|nr:hypothetical protein [Gillisia limnaea]H2BXL5.1 RecName: Full=Probable protease Gilli_2517 [Gillisia limnaea DSM 15749]EHQ03139.1 hypothetical protein Gilli_2517 [Gillisia limnaea DSM 15749]
MHIIFQYPIVDLRDIVSGGNGRLNDPKWPDPQERRQSFVSGFGKVKSRNLGGSDNFTGESYYCDSHSAIKFKELQHQGFSEGITTPASIFNSYRRYYNDGRFVGKVEIGLIDNLEKIIRNYPGSEGIQISSILKHYSNLEATVEDEQVKLYKAGPRLSKKYQRESTLREKHFQINPDYVQTGELTIVLTYSSHERLIVPRRSFSLEKIELPNDAGSIELFGYKLKQDGYPTKVWIIKIPANFRSKSGKHKTILRDLRMNLLRIHLEKETIKILLNAIKYKQIELEKESAEAKQVNAYFEQTSKKLFRKSRYDIKQENLLDFALQSEKSMDKGSFNSLKENITYFQDEFMLDNLGKLVGSMAVKPMLFVCSNPRDSNFIDFDKEYKDLKYNLQRAIDRDHYDIEIELSVTKDEFKDILDRYKPQFLHLSMHATVKDGLHFEDKNKAILPMSVKEFKQIIERYTKKHELKLVLISACNSKNHAKAIKEYCDFAIGTKAVFPVPAALIYSNNFYTTLFNGYQKDLEYCHSGAINAIEFNNPKFDDLDYKNKKIRVHEIPVLIKNSKYV